VSKGASAVADADYLRDSDEEIKFETVSHECAIAVQNARLAKQWTQAQLAKAINEKTGTVIDIESGHGQYVADQINRIEKVLGVKIPRGRKSGGRRKKNPAAGGF
jgi:putative transcription factor